MPHNLFLFLTLLQMPIWRAILKTGEWVVQSQCLGHCAFLSLPSQCLLYLMHIQFCTFLWLPLTDCQGQRKKNLIDVWIGAVTHVRVLASAEPWVPLSESLQSPCLLPFSSIMLFVFACALLSLKCSFKRFLSRWRLVILQVRTGWYLSLLCFVVCLLLLHVYPWRYLQHSEFMSFCCICAPSAVLLIG